jgi:mannose-6-phosphate isomerase-like protein (cupin superfamily)
MSKAKLIKKENAVVIDLGTKRIVKYTSQDKNLEINHMFMTGRQPEVEGTYNYETKCHFMIYILRGSGKFIAEDETFEVEEGDVIDFPVSTRFATEGNFEYLTVESPAFSLDQAFIVDKNNEVIETVEK